MSDKSIESGKTFTDSCNTNDTDGDKLNITKNVISRSVKQNLYSDQVSNLLKHCKNVNFKTKFKHSTDSEVNR